MATAAEMRAAEQQIIVEHQLREKVINEEFKIWKKTAPLLYNTIYTHALPYPLLTVDFFPLYTVSEDKKTLTVQLVAGTNALLRAQDSVSIYLLELPASLAPEVSTLGAVTPSGTSPLTQTKLWAHSGEVNKARVAPDGARFATFDNSGLVHVYDVNTDTPVDLPFHTSEGYCLEWLSEKTLFSGANDAKIALWDVAQPAKPVSTFTSHTAIINDISYNHAAQNILGSVANDFSTQLHDTRAPEQSPALAIKERHLQNAVQWHPRIAHLLATGGKDNVVNLYDVRRPLEPVRQLFGHNDPVVGVQWDPHDPMFLCLWALDKRVITWDLNYMGKDYVQPLLELAEPPKRARNTSDPCLYYVHGGHTNRVNDFAAHPKIPNLFASVGDDTLLEVFQPKTILDDSDRENEDEAEALDKGEDAKEEADDNENEQETGNQNEDETENEKNENEEEKGHESDTAKDIDETHDDYMDVDGEEESKQATVEPQ